jgi:uncharacterized membrane protein YfcA
MGYSLIKVHMAIYLLILGIWVLSLLCLALMIIKFIRQPKEPLSLVCYIKLIISGLLSFIADTLGVGSFAVNIALAKLMGIFRDEEMPGVNNGAQVIPGAMESLFFIGLTEVDITTLLTLVAGACLGGVIGGVVVSRLSKQTVRLVMIGAFALIISLLIIHQFRILSVAGDLRALHSWKLVLGFFALVISGALTSVGVGLFAMVQSILFLMNVTPEVAFPIMAAAGAMQQPLTALTFLQKGKIPLKKTLILSCSGCFGVFIAMFLFKHLIITWLHFLLLFILVYNFFAIGHAYLRDRLDKRYQEDSSNSLVVAK